MSYTKTQWVNDTTPAINANNLNKIEDGIKQAHDDCVDKVQHITGQEIDDIFSED